MKNEEIEEVKPEEFEVKPGRVLSEEDKEFNKKALRINLEYNEIQKDVRNLEIKFLEEQIENNYPLEALKDEIKDLEDGIKRNKVKLQDGKEIDAMPSDVMYMKCKLNKSKGELKLGLPMKKAKLSLRDKLLSKEGPSSYEQVIKDLKERITMIERNHKEVDASSTYIQ